MNESASKSSSIFLNTKKTEGTQLLTSTFSDNDLSALFEMRETHTFCDAKIHLDSGLSFTVHRAIMSACSNFFRALFVTKLNGGSTDVHIPGIRNVIMGKLIDYAYLRKCVLDAEIVYETLCVADYVGMCGLVKMCVEFLITNLTPENCVSNMFFAREHFLKDLEKTARDYVLRNFLQVANTQKILQIGLEDFIDIIGDEMLNAKEEDPVWNCCLKWIDVDPDKRKKHVVDLMKVVRLGLLNKTYFYQNVKAHPYVMGCPKARPLVLETLRFIYDLNELPERVDYAPTPTLAIPRIPHEVMFVIGGWTGGFPTSRLETYDTRADRWISVMHEDPMGPRGYHAAHVIGHYIYVIGGFDGFEHFNTCTRYDCINKSWMEIASMHHKRCYALAAELNGKIYAMGGLNATTRQRSAECYDPATNQWTMIASMQSDRSDGHACTLNGKIYAVGGFNGMECLNSAEYYEPEKNAWTALPPMRSRRSGVCCISYHDHLYVLGGYNGVNRLLTCERFDPEANSWTFICQMYHPRSNFGIGIIDDMIFVAGGFNGINPIAHVECYSDEVDEWLEATDMIVARSAHTLCTVSNLPNIRDYMHQERDQLMEDRRIRLMQENIQVRVGGHLETIMEEDGEDGIEMSHSDGSGEASHEDLRMNVEQEE